MPGLFNKKVLDDRLKNYTVNNIEDKLDKIDKWQNNLANIKGLNETQLQYAFIGAIFESILGYETAPQKDEWTLDIQPTTDVDAKQPDGTIGFYSWEGNEEVKDHRAVIELKGPQISLDKDQKREGTTYKSPVDQAFSYTNKLDGCRWIIVSNFIETRLYQVGRSKEYNEIFYLNDLNEKKEFKRFHYLLNKNHLIARNRKSQTYRMTEISTKKNEDISLEFYNLYKKSRIDLFEHLKENNEEIDHLLLLEKAQKILDRIIFICFCEDKGLLSNTILHDTIKRGRNSFQGIWSELKGLFRAIDVGNKEKNINAFDGGLFEEDEIIQNMQIDDEFFNVIYDFSDHDFDSEVDVNILGHIFEQSITDIEKLKADIREDEYDEEESRRKKEGVYYTPRFITSYIVENAVGAYLEDKKDELGYYDLPDIEEAGSKSWQTRYTQQHIDFYDRYEEELKDLTVLDPACGSGAFLNQAFDFLLEEHRWVNKQRDILKNALHESNGVVEGKGELQASLTSQERIYRNILKNNLYGVDLNKESVEITKLSLWLKTANKQDKLTNLDDNIKCGNSLIDDPDIAGDKAFNWEEEFQEIMNDGGFDVVIGNPPYAYDFNSREKNYLENIFPEIPDYESAYYFLMMSKNILKQSGYISFIIPNMFMANIYAKDFRNNILSEFIIDKIVNLSSEDVFEDPSVRTCIINFSKNHKGFENGNVKLINGVRKTERKQIVDKAFLENRINNWLTTFTSDKSIEDIISKINESNSIKIEEFCDVSQGLIPYDKYVGHSRETIENRIWHANHRKDESYKKLLKGGDVERYFLKWNGERWISYGDWLASPREPRFFNAPRILIREITAPDILATYTEQEYYNDPSIINVVGFDELSPHYVLAILNSTLFTFFHYHSSPKAKKGLFPKILINDVRNLKIKIPKEREKESLIDLSKRMIKKKYKFKYLSQKTFYNFATKFTSNQNEGLKISQIIYDSFHNKIYSGRARKVRNFTVSINASVITLYTEKSSSGKYEMLKFEEDNKLKRKYIKYYLENLGEKQLEEINDKHSGNLLKRVLQIEIPDYDKEHVVRKVVQEWEGLQNEIEKLEEKIEETDRKIDHMVYDLYDLTDEEIKIVEESLS